MISHFRIIEELGRGGMGVVFKAQDTKLDRLVALKFLPAHLSPSEQDKARFIQEAKAAAALNHPNVCSIIDIQEQEGKMFIVMEYVDGQTLRERTNVGQVRELALQLKQAIDIGIQIADGLAAAHEKGIVHRDIKPENIMIRKDGIAQIMDFGLAKLKADGSKITRLTKEGSTLGTAGYMSPEQVQGQDTDHRSDIFSYGVLLYELLTGQLPFKGAHETALAYEIVNVDPTPMSSLKPEIDPNLDVIVLECLEKDINERAQSIKQVSVNLKRYKRESGRQRISRMTGSQPALSQSAAARYGGPIAETKKSSAAFARWTLISSVFFFAGMMTFGAMYFLRPAEKRNVVRSAILPPEKSSYSSAMGGGHLALSPDGSKIAFVATDSAGKSRIWVRALNVLSALPLSGTEGASYPFWSSDNRFIGFFAGAKLRKIDAGGGPPATICEAADGRGGAWNQDGVILLAPNWIGGLYRVSAAGGIPSIVTELDTSRREQTHRWPTFLPDGKHFLYYARSSAGGAETEEDAIILSALDGTVKSRLLAASSNVAYASGHVLFLRQSVLMALPFDVHSLTQIGDAFPIAEQVGYQVAFNRGYFSASNNGFLVYQSGGAVAGNQLSWFDRSGKLVKTVGDPEAYGGGYLSRDEKKLAVSIFDPQARNRDIWIHDVSRGIRTRFTLSPGVEDYPIWSRDGNRIIYSSDKNGHLDLYSRAVNGEGGEELLYASAEDKFGTDISPDGRFLLYYSAGQTATKSDIWALPLVGDRKPILLVQSEFEEVDPQFSPDGKWIAYTSNESGRNEVYVRPFPGPGGKWQISTTGVNVAAIVLAPRWSRDGRELYFHTADQKLVAAQIKISGSSVDIGEIKPMFDTQSRALLYIVAASADGQRFLSLSNASQLSSPLTLVLNWDEEFR